ncbi:MAG: hypothetical protein H6706_24145 [Myxococcales bacterium]|nr:hypothetical protein [Myxococcales bacterium]
MSTEHDDARFVVRLRQATEAPAPSPGFDARLAARLERRPTSTWWLALPAAAALALGVGLWRGPAAVDAADAAPPSVAALAADDDEIYATLDIESAVEESDEVFPEDYATLAEYLDI